MCGFGDKDRRPISPPPILKLSVFTKNGMIIDPETFDVSFLVVTCDAHQDFESPDAAENLRNVKPKIDTIPTVAIDEEGKEQYSAVRMRNLAGATVASAEKLYDLEGNLGIFFIFQDISLRIEGVFKLEFSLVDIEEPPFLHCVNTQSASPVLKTVETKPFTSYTPKNFPGVVQSTPLSECFAKQGIKIPVRKEKSKKQNKKVFSTAQFLSDMDKDC
ncbi:velvet factor [Mucor lusitanicus]|nr:velvet factor [Mucor lusitanicus]